MKRKRPSISLIIPHYHDMFSTFYTLEIIKEVSRAAMQSDVDLLIETAWRVSSGSGILFADIMGNEDWIARAKKQRIPYLILNYYEPDAKHNCIGIDNEKAAIEAVNYLIKSGHRCIAVITGKLNAQAGIQRLAGFKKALKAARLDLDKRHIITGNWTKESGRRAMEKLLLLDKRPTAVFVSGDEMAMGAMELAKEQGLKVPDDISFVGFDNVPQTALPEFSLTTVQQPFSDLAGLGIKNLVRIIEKKTKQPVRILLENIKLIKRASVKEL